MAENSKIEWTTHTFNPWIGCQKVSPGCDFCYAEAMMDHRYGKVQWGPHEERKRTSPANWKLPLKWAKQSVFNDRSRVFCASLADVFDNQAPDAWRTDLWNLILATPELDWLLLTKRPQNITKMMPGIGSLRNVWLGTTAEDQKHFDLRWGVLSQIPATVRFISYEPAIGPLSMGCHASYPDWVICGGESGPHAREMDPVWAENIKHECQNLGVAFFMKQMSKKKPIPDYLMLRQFPVSHLFQPNPIS